MHTHTQLKYKPYMERRGFYVTNLSNMISAAASSKKQQHNHKGGHKTHKISLTEVGGPSGVLEI